MPSTDVVNDHAIAEPSYAVFVAHRLLASGPREKVLRATKKHLDKGGSAPLVFEESSGRQVDFDFRGSIDDVLARTRAEAKPGPGRPRLGVISREVSLLPRHWDWLENQPNGASAAIRRLVDEARHNESGIERARHVRNAIGRVLWSLAGDLPSFEEVVRAIDSRDDARVETLVAAWPKDLRGWIDQRLEVAKAIERW